MRSPSNITNKVRTIIDKLYSFVSHYGRILTIGVLMGSADAVPGISGGTVALIAGIYGRLITAITAITPSRFLDFLRAILPLYSETSRQRAGAILRECDAMFVITLITGVAIAVVIVGRIVEYAEERVPVLLFGFFFGLIAASAVILWRELTMNTLSRWLAAFVGFSFAFVLSGSVQILEDSSLAVIFAAGAVGVSAMILPGISGSLLLIILGQYIPMYESLNNFLDGVSRAITGSGEFEAVIAPGREVFTFLLGGLIGLFTVSRLIRRLLDRNRETTLAFLVALVFGALRAPISELSATEGVDWGMATVGEFGGLAFVGAILVLGLDWYAIDIDFGSL